jgi:hypothetical protein
VKAEPSCILTPLRIVKVQVSLSEATDQSIARPG